MKKNSKVFWLSMVAVMALAACGGDDDAAPSNQVKLDGKTIKFDEADLGSQFDIDDDFGTYSYHEFFLTSEGLAVSETGLLSGSGDMVAFGLISESATELQEGTYELKLNTEVGDVDYFEAYYDYSQSNLDTYYAGYRGTVKISKSGIDRYSVSFDIDIFTSESETSDEEFVNGSIKGNYKGTVDLITSSGTRKHSVRMTKGRKDFLWE
jgi:hypothetical protein